MSSNIEQILDTIDYHDPHRRTIPIGTAAINLQLAAAHIDPPLPASDIDAMAPAEQWQALIDKHLGLEDVMEVHVKRWSPHNSAVVELIPDPKLHPTHLPFSACMYMNDHIPASHSSIQASGQTIDALGVPCLALPAALEWKARIGREKDWAFLATVLPIIIEAGLLRGDQLTPIDDACMQAFDTTVVRNPAFVS